MGRNCGAIAIWTGISVGAEYVACREIGYNEEDIIQTIRDASKTKRHAIVIITENLTNVEKLAETITTSTPFEARATVLGHVQRGGSPTPRDRVLAATLGVRAVEELVNGNSGVAICEVNNQIVAVPFETALKSKKDQVFEKYETFKVLW
jgi:6-phosphofructokinase 1